MIFKNIKVNLCRFVIITTTYASLAMNNENPLEVCPAIGPSVNGCMRYASGNKCSKVKNINIEWVQLKMYIHGGTSKAFEVFLDLEPLTNSVSPSNLRLAFW